MYPRPICQEEEGYAPGGGTRPRREVNFRELREVRSTEHEDEQPIGDDKKSEDGKLKDEKAEELLETVSERFWSEKTFLRVMDERKTILDNPKLTARQKRQLLETSRYPLAVVTNRGIPFRTEEVVRWMLIYSMAVVIILALLTAFAHLEKEVTISFVGTVIGGMIATVAQKLGKIGS
jgi:hypothetical protein